MTSQELLTHLKSLNVKIWAEDGKLRYRGPESALTPGLRAKLAERKQEIIRVLIEPPDSAKKTSMSIRPAPRGAEVPLSFAQQSLWFLYLLNPDSAVYNIPFALALEGKLDFQALEHGLSEIVGRHEVFRTTFATVDSRPVQVIAEARPLSLPVIDLKGLPEAEKTARAERLIAEESRKPFNLTQDPPYRFSLLRLEDQRHVLLVTVHHIIFDGWSINLFRRELRELYNAFRAGNPSPLPAPPLQYADFAVWQREWLQGERFDVQIAYWKQKLADAPQVLKLPTDRPRPSVQSFKGATHPIRIDKPLMKALNELSAVEGCTLFILLLAAFNVLLSRYSVQEDILVGSPVAGRANKDLEKIMGFFANMVVLRADLSSNPTFRELLGRVRETALGAFAHGDAPFEKLVEALQPERALGHNPLFQVALSLTHEMGLEDELDGLSVRLLDVNNSTSMFDLELQLMVWPEEITGVFWHNTELFETATIARLASHFENLLEAIVADPDRPIQSLPILTEAERRRLLAEWNNTATDYRLDECPHQVFERQVERAPEAIAVICERERLTYRQLNRKANRLARILVEQGVGPESLVALLDDRGGNFLTAMLAVFKAGGAYLPLSPDHPSARLRQVIEQSRSPLALAGSKYAPAISEALADWPAANRPRLLIIEELLEQEQSEENLPPSCGPNNLAYAIFTSGSTGLPKGAMIERRGLLNHLYAKIETLRLDLRDVVAQNASQCFDVSVWQFLAPLLVGGAVDIIPNLRANDPALLLNHVEEAGVTILEIVPSMLKAMIETLRHAPLATFKFESLRWLIPTGEALPAGLCRQWLEFFPNTPLMNTYGATETSDDASQDPIVNLPKEEDSEIMPLGAPLGNMRLYVLDAFCELAPVGVPGEVYIGGVGVGRGYLGQPQLTAERFIPDPFSDQPGARLYKTGDLARYLSDDSLRFIGRADHQVKVRGHRIELGEIEGMLLKHDAVEEAIVITEGESGKGVRLIAFVTTKAEAQLANGELKRFLKERAPDYMAPDVIVEMTSLPLNSNGKIDRRALAGYAQPREAEEELIAPRTPVEETLAGIWAELLGLDRVGVQENFFELGGHSLLATQVISRLREIFHIELPLRSFFEYPTIAECAEVIEDAMRREQRAATPPLVPVARDIELPLSFAQQRLWLMAQLEPEGSAYNAPAAFRLTGTLDVEAFSRSLSEICRRHESLRTTFSVVEGRPVQRISSASPLVLERIDLSEAPQEDREAEAMRLAHEEARRPFDLAKGPLVRARLLKLAENEHIVLFTMHHIVNDGWSVAVLKREVAMLYEAFSKGQPSPLPELPIQYADFSYWQRNWLQGDALEEQLSYWRRRLNGAPDVLELPTDRPRPAVQKFDGATQSVHYPIDLLESLRSASRREGVTLYMLLLAAFSALLSRLTGQQDIVIGSPIANRTRSEVEGLIGFFVNTLALRTELSGDPTFGELLRRVRETVLGAYAHQDLPFEKLVEALRPERVTSYSPIFQVMLVLQNTPPQILDLSGLSITALPVDSGMAKFDLTLFIEELNDGLAINAQYDSNLFNPGAISRILRQFRALLESVAADSTKRVSTLAVSTGDESQQSIGGFNDLLE